MTSLPETISPHRLGLVIDLDTCVGCQACVVACKEWNTGGYPAPLTDQDPYGANARGAWLNRVHTFEAGEGADGRTVHFPKSCLHCENAECVTVCPTGARHFGDLAEPDSRVSRLVAERGGFDLMPETGYRPTNKYLPPRPGKTEPGFQGAPEALEPAPAGGFLAWLDWVLGD